MANKLSTQQLIKAKQLGLNPETATPAQIEAAIANQSKAKLGGAPPTPEPDPDGDAVTLAELAEALHLPEQDAREVAIAIYGEEPVPRSDLADLREMADDLVAESRRADHRIQKAIALRDGQTGLINESLEMAAREGEALAADANSTMLNAYLNARLDGIANLYSLASALHQTAEADRQSKAAELGNGMSPAQWTRRMGEEATRRQRADDIRTRQRDGLAPNWGELLT